MSEQGKRCGARADNDPAAPCVRPEGHSHLHCDTYGKQWLLHKYGPPASYEIMWKSGHTETVDAHQVSYMYGPRDGVAFLGEAERVQFHADLNGRWSLILSAQLADIRTIRRRPDA